MPTDVRNAFVDPQHNSTVEKGSFFVQPLKSAGVTSPFTEAKKYTPYQNTTRAYLIE